MTLLDASVPVGAPWPEGVVPYRLGAGVPEAAIREAMAIWQEHSKGRVRFVPRVSQVDHAFFQIALGGSSRIGRTGRRQPVNVPPGAGAGLVLHELGHLLGLHHEHSRFDRDQFITVHPELELDTEAADDLRRCYRRFDDGRPYDYASVMHYPARATAGAPVTIAVLDASAVIGLREKPSDGDLASLALLYPDP